MLQPGQVFESPRGTRVEILANSPEQISVKRTLPPLTGGRQRKPRGHRHGNFAEHFKVLDGQVTGSLDDREHTVKAGEELNVPQGSAHVNPYTKAGETATMVHTVKPRTRDSEIYFTSWLGWMADGTADANDEPTLTQIAAMIRGGGRGRTWATNRPVFVQRIGLGLLGLVAAARGIRAARVP